MMIEKFLRLGRRQLHTIISRETIKPSSPTPTHLHTYNRSSLDQIFPHTYSPLVLFYPNNDSCSVSADDKAQLMKKSLSQSLTRYYPFAGRIRTPTSPNIDCNDEGVVFVEARNNAQLKALQNISEHDEILDELFADGMVCQNSPDSTNIVGVQVNHFSCGGVALGVSMSHIIGDAFTQGSFVNHWASVARHGSTNHEDVMPLNPYFIHSPSTESIQPKDQVIKSDYANHVTRKFVFPNTNLYELKNKVMGLAAAGSTPPMSNPTRMEVLTSLLYKAAVAATSTKSGGFKPCHLVMPVNIRSKLVQKLPETTVGNILSAMTVSTRETSETSLSVIVSEIKKAKSQLQSVQSVEHAADELKLLMSTLGIEDIEAAKRLFMCSSLCGFPYNKVDFGWGKPMGATLALHSYDRNGFVLQDTPDGDGIEALVTLEKEDMKIFQNDKEMLSFCQINKT